MKKIKTLGQLEAVKLFIIVVSISVCSLSALHAQENPTKEVIIEKEYEPVVREAQRIELLPDFQDTTKAKIDFNYDIKSSVIYGQFKPQIIKPVRLTGEPLASLNRCYALLGVGNYLSTIAKFRVNSLRHEKYQWFFGLDQSNSFGMMKDRYEKKVYAGFSNTEVTAGGKHFFKNAVLEGKILYNYQKNHYYGYEVNPDSLSDELKNKLPVSREKSDYQYISKFNSEVSMYSFHTNKSKLNYNVGVVFNHIQAQNKVIEDDFAVKIYLDKYFNAQFMGFQGNVRYIKNEGLIDTANNFIVDFNPWIGLFGKQWRMQLGLNSAFDANGSEYYAYPNIQMHYNIESYFLVPYVEITGNYQVNTFERIIEENFYINPMLAVRPTNNNLTISGGIRGMVSSRLGFNINFTYRNIKDQYFYVIDTTDGLGRFFNVEYDDMSVAGIGGELSWKQSDQLNIIVRANYRNYVMDSLPHPWHLPKTTVDVTARYRMLDKLTISTDVFYRGERTSKSQFGNQTVDLSPIIDVNLMGEYQYNRILGFFVKFNNLLNRSQYVWANYQLHRFNMKAGLILLF